MIGDSPCAWFRAGAHRLLSILWGLGRLTSNFIPTTILLRYLKTILKELVAKNVNYFYFWVVRTQKIFLFLCFSHTSNISKTNMYYITRQEVIEAIFKILT